MGLFNSLKSLFKKEEKEEITIQRIEEVDSDKEIKLDDLGIQTSFNTDDINDLVEDGEVENVQD